MDLVVRNAHLRNRLGTWDTGITGDHIVAVAEHMSGVATLKVDAAGNLVVPTYVNGHIHLDKCNPRDKMRPNKTYSWDECLELTWEHKAQYSVEDIIERAGRAVEEGMV